MTLISKSERPSASGLGHDFDQYVGKAKCFRAWPFGQDVGSAECVKGLEMTSINKSERPVALGLSHLVRMSEVPSALGLWP
ncbi:hypothetical protein DPMN_165981 [Dreissena polymorpha]|uniref:Uncharacterized protein n=1 Tax=Dreissena polymorpha TaxID=45954 RepID=A0A9D4IV38_DREPO|nr:hypothetical protein DPMN_165981 [Dreissena polymorpha]